MAEIQEHHIETVENPTYLDRQYAVRDALCNLQLVRQELAMSDVSLAEIAGAYVEMRRATKLSVEHLTELEKGSPAWKEKFALVDANRRITNELETSLVTLAQSEAMDRGDSQTDASIKAVGYITAINEQFFDGNSLID